jgi:hypothetical protein
MPGIIPPTNIARMEVFVNIQYMMKVVLGGMIGSSIAEAATRDPVNSSG